MAEEEGRYEHAEDTYLMDMIPRGTYPNDKCPDCGRPIDFDAREGDKCPDCRHTL
jgi:ribosomal protein S27E